MVMLIVMWRLKFLDGLRHFDNVALEFVAFVH